MVSIHRVSVNVFLIISDVCLIFRFKRGDSHQSLVPRWGAFALPDDVERATRNPRRCIIQYTTPKGAYTPMARSQWSTYATLRGVVDKTSHGHLPLPCPRHHLKVAKFLSVKNKAYDKRLFWIAVPSPCPATAHQRVKTTHTLWHGKAS